MHYCLNAEVCCTASNLPDRQLHQVTSVSARRTESKKEPAYNGKFGCTCYHLLSLLNPFGDLQYAMLRRGATARVKYG